MSPPLPTGFRHLVYALADALDLVGIDDVGHGKRVGIMAAEVAETLGLAPERRLFLFELGLLHDIGVSSTVTHHHLVTEFDWEGAQAHCLTGAELLRDFAPLQAYAEPIRYHHTPWARLPADLPADLRQAANLVFLVDRVDAFAAPHYGDGSLLMSTGEIRDAICQHDGSYFDPALVAAFLQASRSEAFWLRLEMRNVQASLADRLNEPDQRTIAMAELKQLAGIFSRIVDAKSAFTAQHSLGVSRLAGLLAGYLGVAPERREQLEIAGLLHDIGKLRVPDEVLDKPARLDARERSIMNTHSFETYQILRLIPGLEEIAYWAACHHEEPGGNGYPFHLAAETLPLEARILRVADIFQAMVQDRPYRRGLPASEALAFVGELVTQGRVDGTIAATLAKHLDAAYAAARPESP